MAKPVYKTPDWLPIIAFVVACYAVTWLACIGFRRAAANGEMWAFWTFLLVTVWSPTFVAIVVTMFLGGYSDTRNLLRRLFRRPSLARIWYLVAIVFPSLAVFVATIIARALNQGAPLIPIAAVLPTIGIQVGTGALGEELGWRGFLLPLLQKKANPVTSAVIMSLLWSLWHSPSFFFPGMPQVLVSPFPFFTAVAAFGIFLSLIFNKTEGHVLGTILAHLSINTSLALGGARFGNTLWWSLTGVFSLLACGSGLLLSRTSDMKR
jgi:uncharacterized protein